MRSSVPLQIHVQFGTGFLAGIVAASVTFVVGNLALLYTLRKQLQVHASVISSRSTIIDFVSGIVADILQHPAVDAALSQTIARGVNRWMSSVEAQDAIRAMVIQTPREEAIRGFGKEVPGYVLHFAGGVVDAITGKKEDETTTKQQQQQQHSSQN
jgi:hypothetical protein